MVEATLDEILRLLENPTRRRILGRLARESHYPLQLSRELGVSQQAVMKHLRALEEAGLVSFTAEKSDLGGPERRAYTARQSLSLRIDVGPALFRAEMRPLAGDGEKVEGFAWLDDTLRRVREEKDPRKRIRRIGEVIQRLNGEIAELDRRRSHAVRHKDALLREAHGAVEDILGGYEERQVLYYVLDEGVPALEKIAEDLDLREKVVEDLLRRIEREFALTFRL